MENKLEKMEELLLFALPYMEDCIDDPCYKESGRKELKNWVREVRGIFDEEKE